MPAPTTQPDPRPLLAVVSISCPPYRHHTLRRIAAEIPEIRLASVFTHDSDASAWDPVNDPAIHPVRFGDGDPGEWASDPRHYLAERRRGKRLTRWLDEQRPAAVICNGWSAFTTRRVQSWCRRRRVPYFIWCDSNIHGDRATGLKRALKNLLVAPTIRAAAGCLVFGENGRRYVERYGARPERTFLVPYACEYGLATSTPPEAVETIRENHGLAEGRRRILYSGRLIPLKRVDTLIDAFAVIAPDRPGWDLVILGEGPLEAELRARVPESLRGRVTWTGFFKRPEDVFAMYLCCDVLALCSNIEAWGLVIPESAACSCAQVASHVVGAVPELVIEGENGAVFTAEDVASLTDALRRVTDPGRIDALRRRSREIFTDWSAHTDAIAGLRAALSSAGVLSEERRSGASRDRR